VRLSENARRWIESATHSRVVAVSVIAGATSSRLDDVELGDDAGGHHVVLRRFTDSKWVKREPDVAVREAMSLQHATRAGLPAPALIAVDAHGEHCGVPATLVEKMAGTVVLEPTNRREWVAGLAESAARIHRVEASGFRWKYRRYNEGHRLTVPAWSKEPAAWQTAIEMVQDPPPSYRECFIHRDYHPSNVLWENGRVTAVVDWVNGCRGPAGIDVAWCRHNLANLHGVAVADDFLSAYIDAAGSEFDYDPYWDLMTVVELLPGPPSMYSGWRSGGIAPLDSSTMRQRVDAYVASVVARLEG
jgi:aminoglycoside phosphotransferase (APT) family kinase protein